MLASRRLFYILIALCVILIIIFLYKRAFGIASNLKMEGFTQTTPFVLKRDEDVYDDFYSEIYDDLFKDDEKTKYIIRGIIDITKPTPNHSVFLDVGSGTGENIRTLQDNKYNAFGVEKSRSMMKMADKKCGCSKGYNKSVDQEIIKYGNVLDPMLYEHSTFTHILLLNETIYEIEDKKKLIHILRGWLKQNGFLIVNVVSRKRYTATQEKEFNGVSYKSSYHTGSSGAGANARANEIVFQEKLIDKKTSYVRQNEKTLYVEPILDLVQCIKHEGFIVHGIIDLKPITNDEYQYLYIFEAI